MSALSKSRLVFFAFALASATAQASSITGKIALGTWNTQVEFANVKVTKGAQVLLQSDFRKGMAGWTQVGGTWSTLGNTLRQTGGATPALIVAGDPTWTDYTLTLKARKTGGAEGFLVGFGMPDNGAKSWLNVGGWGNTLHALEAPGIAVPAVPGTIPTGVWVSVQIDVRGSDVRCSLNGRKVFDTMRLLGADELAVRRAQALVSSGFALLPTWEQDQLRQLLNRDVYLGRAARETFATMPSGPTFADLTAAKQVPILRRINRNRLTWRLGGGFGNDAGRDQTIIAGVDDAVALHNRMGVVDKELVVNNNPAVPTAEANWDGVMSFGGSIGYRVALHEMSHAVGTGTYYPAWGDLMVNGAWNGTYANLALRQITGDAGAVLHGDGAHYWPFGLNYDSELGDGDDVRNTQIVRGLRRDMGINGVLDTMYTTDVPDGAYRLTPRLAPDSALEAGAGTLKTALTIRAYQGAPSQKFRLKRMPDNTYVIRTTLATPRTVELAGEATNGQTVRLFSYNASDAQRWYLIPMGDGWFKIAPKTNV